MPDPVSQVFGLTYSDLQRKIAPSSGEQVFLIADSGGDLTKAAAVGYINQAEERLRMRMPQWLSRVLTRVDGEILTSRAAGGETTFTVALAPVVAGTLRLWKNFPDRSFWRNRPTDEAMATADFSVVAATGWLGLRELVLAVAANTVAHDFEGFSAREVLDGYETAEKNAFLEVSQMKGAPWLTTLRTVEDSPDNGDFYQGVVVLGGSGACLDNGGVAVPAWPR